MNENERLESEKLLMMKCKNCDNKIPFYESVCHYCGEITFFEDPPEKVNDIIISNDSLNEKISQEASCIKPFKLGTLSGFKFKKNIILKEGERRKI